MYKLKTKHQSTITIDKVLMPTIKKILRDERRSMSAYVNDLVHKDVERRKREETKAKTSDTAED